MEYYRALGRELRMDGMRLRRKRPLDASRCAAKAQMADPDKKRRGKISF